MLNEKDVKEIVHALNHLPAEKVEEAVRRCPKRALSLVER